MNDKWIGELGLCVDCWWLGGQVNSWFGRWINFLMDRRKIFVLMDKWMQDLRCVVSGCLY
jgi:hypothetical protein